MLPFSETPSTSQTGRVISRLPRSWILLHKTADIRINESSLKTLREPSNGAGLARGAKVHKK